MTSIAKISQAAKGGGSLSKRLLSSLTVGEGIGYDDASGVKASSSASSCSASSTASRRVKMSHVLANSASQQFLNSISEKHIGPSFIPSAVLSTEDKIKLEIHSLIDRGEIEKLLSILVELTSRTSTAANPWTAYISPRDLSYYARVVVDAQIKSIRQVAELKKTGRKGHGTEVKFLESQSLKNGIRQLYANVLYPETNQHLYAKSSSSSPYANSTSSSSSPQFQLSPLDYENLATLELHNGKLDLASKWLFRFENQYPQKNEYMKHMTLPLWILRLKVYCGGVPFLWKVPDTEISYGSNGQPRRGRLMSEKSWISVFNDFLQSQKLYKNTSQLSQGTLNNDFNETLIYSIGYARNVDYLVKYIESFWGITPEGNMVPNFKTPNRDDSTYPDLRILRAIVTSLSYNQKFFQSMTYVNKFQEVYGLDVAGVAAKNLWDNIFKWSESNTRFSEDKALAYFIKHNTKTSPNTQHNMSLEEAQQSVDFNYEGYLNFISELQSKRDETIQQLWELYTKSHRFFSPQPYKTYFEYLTGRNKGEEDLDKYFDLLSRLMKHYESYHISHRSFNKRYLKVNDTDETIYALYDRIFRKVIDVKGYCGNIRQIEPLINEWSLDDKMHYHLNAWMEVQLPVYREALEQKRLEVMMKQRTEREDDEDDLLGIMS